MRFSEIAKGTRAVKRVKFRLANGPAPSVEPGQAPPDDPSTVEVGVRVLTGEETATVYYRAQEAARAKGVDTWDGDREVCRLFLYVHSLVLGCVDPDSPEGGEPRPFFDSAEQILASPDLGTDNIAFLYEQLEAWQDECSIRPTAVGLDQAVAIILREADRPENAKSPFDGMRPAMLRSYLRTLAPLLRDLLRDRLLSTSPSDTSGIATSKSA